MTGPDNGKQAILPIRPTNVNSETARCSARDLVALDTFCFIVHSPKTLERVHVPPKRTVKFKVGRLMKQKLQEGMTAQKTNPTR